MNLDHVIVQRGAAQGAQLFMLFHRSGDNPTSMAQIGLWFAKVFPQAHVISVGGPHEVAETEGSEWFNSTHRDDAEHPRSMAQNLPGFIKTVRYWQQATGVGAEATALVGFSEGATMILEAVTAEEDLAGRAIIFAGRFVNQPSQASDKITIHLIHGEDDEVNPLMHAVQAQEWVTELGGDITLDIIDELPHAIDDRGLEFALNHLQRTVPKRYFDQAAQSSAAPGEDDVLEMM